VPDASPAPRNDAPLTESRTFTIDRHAVAAVDAWIEDVGRSFGASQATVFGARLCVAELFANVIEHGIGRSERDRITVTLARSADGIGIEFVDTCGRFDPTHVAAPVQGESIEDAPVGGRGLTLVRGYAKEFAYRHDGARNRTTLRIAAR